MVVATSLEVGVSLGVVVESAVFVVSVLVADVRATVVTSLDVEAGATVEALLVPGGVVTLPDFMVVGGLVVTVGAVVDAAFPERAAFRDTVVTEGDTVVDLTGFAGVDVTAASVGLTVTVDVAVVT